MRKKLLMAELEELFHTSDPPLQHGLPDYSEKKKEELLPSLLCNSIYMKLKEELMNLIPDFVSYFPQILSFESKPYYRAPLKETYQLLGEEVEWLYDTPNKKIEGRKIQFLNHKGKIEEIKNKDYSILHRDARIILKNDIFPTGAVTFPKKIRPGVQKIAVTICVPIPTHHRKNVKVLNDGFKNVQEAMMKLPSRDLTIDNRYAVSMASIKMVVRNHRFDPNHRECLLLRKPGAVYYQFELHLIDYKQYEPEGECYHEAMTSWQQRATN